MIFKIESKIFNIRCLSCTPLVTQFATGPIYCSGGMFRISASQRSFCAPSFLHSTTRNKEKLVLLLIGNVPRSRKTWAWWINCSF